jgi:hypothetical protein
MHLTFAYYSMEQLVYLHIINTDQPNKAKTERIRKRNKLTSSAPRSHQFTHNTTRRIGETVKEIPLDSYTIYRTTVVFKK